MKRKLGKRSCNIRACGPPRLPTSSSSVSLTDFPGSASTSTPATCPRKRTAMRRRSPSTKGVIWARRPWPDSMPWDRFRRSWFAGACPERSYPLQGANSGWKTAWSVRSPRPSWRARRNRRRSWPSASPAAAISSPAASPTGKGPPPPCWARLDLKQKTMNASQPIFVYGTLKRGECRGGCWPRAPRSVQPGFIRGRLLDLGPFPGWVPGDGWIRGEVWEIGAADLAATLETLDEIEGYRQPHQPDQYERLTVALFASPAKPSIGSGFTYHLVDPDLRRRGRVVP